MPGVAARATRALVSHAATCAGAAYDLTGWAWASQDEVRGLFSRPAKLRLKPSRNSSSRPRHRIAATGTPALDSVAPYRVHAYD